jgi:hypothetical protein
MWHLKNKKYIHVYVPRQQKCTVKVQIGHSDCKIRNLDIAEVYLEKKIRQKSKSNFANFARDKQLFTQISDQTEILS